MSFSCWESTYNPSISAANVHQGSGPGPQHPEDVLHLCRGGRDERQAHLPQSRGHEGSGPGVQGEQWPAQYPCHQHTQPAPAPGLQDTASSSLGSRCREERLVLRHDAIARLQHLRGWAASASWGWTTGQEEACQCSMSWTVLRIYRCGHAPQFHKCPVQRC